MLLYDVLGELEIKALYETQRVFGFARKWKRSTPQIKLLIGRSTFATGATHRKETPPTRYWRLLKLIPFLCGSRLSDVSHQDSFCATQGNNDDHNSNLNFWSETKSTSWTKQLGERSQNPRATVTGSDRVSTTKVVGIIPWPSAFWTFPEEQGWIPNEPLSEWHHCSNEEAATRAQEWLYFHLLDSFLGVHVDIHTFTKSSLKGGKIVVDSSTLLQLLQEWDSRNRCTEIEDLDSENNTPRDQEYSEALGLLARVLHTCNELNEEAEPLKSVVFSIRILVESLAKAVWRRSNSNATEHWRIWKLGPSSLIAERITNAGWCRFRIAKLWYQYLPSTMYYLSSLPRQETFGGVTHHNCTADQCTATSVDPITYQHRHRETCGTGAENNNFCDMIDVDTGNIADIILQNSFPLIEIQPSANGRIKLEVHKHTIGVRYVAISHVWSGGLGNVKTNAMRTCQLQYLHSLILRLRKNGDDDLDRRHGSRKIDDAIDDFRVHFGFPRKRMPLLLWIDTLCVPVGSEYKAAYTETLRRMAQIYVTAQCVLVLDPELQNIKHCTLQREQKYAHILSSSWMSRCWTFQEACVARVWFVQFADGHLAVDEQYFEFQREVDESIERNKDTDTLSDSLSRLPFTARSSESQTVWLMYDLTHWFRDIPVLAKIRHRDPRELMSKMEDWQNFALAWNGLRDRSTTKAEDLDGIIAVAVDLSAGDILKLRQDERLKAIYRSQKTLPCSLLYQTSPKILDERGYETWAPSRIKGEQLDLYSGYLTVSAAGLLLSPDNWVNMRAPQAILVNMPGNLAQHLEIDIHESHSKRRVELLMGPLCHGQTTSDNIDFALWPSPIQHVSKRALSRRVIIRNTSNWINLSAIGLVSGPYIIGIIVCATRRQNALAAKLLWLCLSRWLSLMAEVVWVLASLAHWDRHRTIDWTDRLYGTTPKPRIQQLQHAGQYPAFIAKVPPLVVASTLLRLYYSHHQYYWMKVFAVVLFADVGLSLVFTLFTIYAMFLYIGHGWYEPVTRTFFSDLPEDATETLESQLQYLEAKWQPDVDHRYKIAIFAWKVYDLLKSKKGTRETNDGIDMHDR
ncbi:MAG: hypothetical protein Q9219_000761 [cf. Caloplaca sp. 3 TL-2023]